MSRTNDEVNYSKLEILSQLDHYAKDYDFPILDNAHYILANVRMNVFRNSKEWLVVFEVVAAAITQGLMVRQTYAYGNKLHSPGLQLTEEIVKETLEQPWWDSNMNFILNTWNFQIFINDKLIEFKLSEEDYKKADLYPIKVIDPLVRTIRIINFLYSSLLLASKQQLLKLCHRRVKHFLQLDKWHHPDVLGCELPSCSISFQTLADAIVKNNICLYVYASEEDNTHWSYWENTGE
jgi:hypothetical protein